MGRSSGQSCFSSLLRLKCDSLIANMCCVWAAGGNCLASEAQDKKKITAGLCIHLKKWSCRFYSFRSVGQLVLLMPYHSLKADSDIYARRKNTFHLLEELVAGARGHYNIFLWIMGWIIKPTVQQDFASHYYPGTLKNANWKTQMQILCDCTPHNSYC